MTFVRVFGIFIMLLTISTSLLAGRECKGMTFVVKDRKGPYILVGHDHNTNPYHGDTWIDVELPILGINKTGLPRPNLPGMTYKYNVGWCAGELKMTHPICGNELDSYAHANQIVEGRLGEGFRMAEFHDGGGGWSFWGLGDIPIGQRFWVYINDQKANLWDTCKSGAYTIVNDPNQTSASPNPPINRIFFNHMLALEFIEERMGEKLPVLSDETLILSQKGYIVNGENDISHISFWNTRVKDLSPIEFAPITHLNLSGSMVNDLIPVGKMKNLICLKLVFDETSKHSAKFTDCTPLRHLSKLEFLEMSGFPLKKMDFLQNLKALKHVKLNGMYISDFDALRYAKNLETLILNNNRISDVAPLKTMKNLKRLELQNNPISRLPLWICDWKPEIDLLQVFQGCPLDKRTVKALFKGGRTGLWKVFSHQYQLAPSSPMQKPVREDPDVEMNKYNKAMADIRAAGEALFSYVLDQSKAPDATDIIELKKTLEPFYIKTFPVEDPWGNPYVYRKIGSDDFIVGSAGNDGKFQPLKKESFQTAKGQDVLFSNEEFISRPTETSALTNKTPTS